MFHSQCYSFDAFSFQRWHILKVLAEECDLEDGTVGALAGAGGRNTALLLLKLILERARDLHLAVIVITVCPKQ